MEYETNVYPGILIANEDTLFKLYLPDMYVEFVYEVLVIFKSKKGNKAILVQYSFNKKSFNKTAGYLDFSNFTGHIFYRDIDKKATNSKLYQNGEKVSCNILADGKSQFKVWEQEYRIVINGGLKIKSKNAKINIPILLEDDSDDEISSFGSFGSFGSGDDDKLYYATNTIPEVVIVGPKKSFPKIPIGTRILPIGYDYNYVMGSGFLPAPKGTKYRGILLERKVLYKGELIPVSKAEEMIACDNLNNLVSGLQSGNLSPTTANRIDKILNATGLASESLGFSLAKMEAIAEALGKEVADNITITKPFSGSPVSGVKILGGIGVIIGGIQFFLVLSEKGRNLDEYTMNDFLNASALVAGAAALVITSPTWGLTLGAFTLGVAVYTAINQDGTVINVPENIGESPCQ